MSSVLFCSRERLDASHLETHIHCDHLTKPRDESFVRLVLRDASDEHESVQSSLENAFVRVIRHEDTDDHEHARNGDKSDDRDDGHRPFEHGDGVVPQ